MGPPVYSPRAQHGGVLPPVFAAGDPASHAERDSRNPGDDKGCHEEGGGGRAEGAGANSERSAVRAQDDLQRHLWVRVSGCEGGAERVAADRGVVVVKLPLKQVRAGRESSNEKKNMP